METSQFIARLAGPVLAAVGIGLLANQAAYRQLAGQFLVSYPFIYVSGVLLMLAGLSILNAHNAWTRDWRSAVTLLGWVLCVIGVYRIIAMQFVNFVGSNFLTTPGFLTGAGIVLLGFGSFLSFKGYTA